MHRIVAAIHAIVRTIPGAPPFALACGRAKRAPGETRASFVLGRGRRSGKIPRFWPPSTALRPLSRRAEVDEREFWPP
ncbi:hypothetical protein X946_5315 [Burkholderia sp. ABCPW 111]|nr:hypothetical protein X946_5315 [Burkholderia sp. ABCPW 111]